MIHSAIATVCSLFHIAEIKTDKMNSCCDSLG
jgi:hypothetical protein